MSDILPPIRHEILPHDVHVTAQSSASRAILGLQYGDKLAFDVFDPTVQTTEVQVQTPGFNPLRIATLALRAVGADWETTLKTFDSDPTSVTGQEIEQTYRALRLHDPLQAAKSVSVAFSKGLFKPIESPDSFPVLSMAQNVALKAILKGSIRTSELRKLQQHFGVEDIPMLISAGYSMQSFKPNRVVEGIKYKDDWSSLDALTTLTASGPWKDSVPVESQLAQMRHTQDKQKLFDSEAFPDGDTFSFTWRGTRLSFDFSQYPYRKYNHLLAIFTLGAEITEIAERFGINRKALDKRLTFLAKEYGAYAATSQSNIASVLLTRGILNYDKPSHLTEPHHGLQQHDITLLKTLAGGYPLTEKYYWPLPLADLHRHLREVILPTFGVSTIREAILAAYTHGIITPTSIDRRFVHARPAQLKAAERVRNRSNTEESAALFNESAEKFADQIDAIVANQPFQWKGGTFQLALPHDLPTIHRKVIAASLFGLSPQEIQRMASCNPHTYESVLNQWFQADSSNIARVQRLNYALSNGFLLCKQPITVLETKPNLSEKQLAVLRYISQEYTVNDMIKVDPSLFPASTRNKLNYIFKAKNPSDLLLTVYSLGILSIPQKN